MKSLAVVVFLFFLLAQPALSANDNYPFGARQAGMGNAGVTLYDLWSVSHNQAGLARLQALSAGFYFENRFLAREMALGAVAAALPLPSGVFGLSLSYFGFSLYNEGKIGLSYARDFGEKLSVGMQFNYMYLSIGEGYGSRGNFTLEVGMIYELLSGLHIGAHLFNPTQSRITGVDDLYDEHIPTILRFGLSYAFSDRVLLAVETEKDINEKARFKVGIEYRLTDHIHLRGGVGTRPMENAFGFGFQSGNLQFDLSAAYHHVLGYSPQAGVTYGF